MWVVHLEIHIEHVSGSNILGLLE